MQKRILLIIGFVWPEPNTTAAGNRMQQLVHFFLAQKYQIVFASTASESEQSMNLDVLRVQKIHIQLNHVSFDQFVQELMPEIVLFDRFLTEEQFGWRVAEFAPNALRILDTEDLHSLRHAREKAFKSGIDFTTHYWLQNDITKREMASIYRSDISMIISSYEMKLLKNVIKVDENILLHLPFMVNALEENQQRAWKSFDDRKDFICIGNGKHYPNIAAVLWLKKEIWPMIRKKLPETQLHIYGAYLPEHIQQMNNVKEGFLVHGWASDLKEVMENTRVNLAPVQFGAGLKGKLLDAMRFGTPSVTTTIGAEGMHDDLTFNGVIADDAKDIAQAAINLYQNQLEWSKAQENGIQIINTLYDVKIWTQRLLSKIENVQADLEQHRNRNFMGRMLMHQTLASTKYMSKWIEEKRKQE